MMDNPRQSDNQLDRILGAGALSGPEADRLWEQIAPKVIQPAPSWRTAVASWWLRGGVGLVMAAAAVLVWRIPDSMDGMRPRGGLGQAVLEGSCGSPVPCTVGQPLFLRVTPASANVMLFVLLRDAQHTSLLVDGVVLTGGLQTLNVRVVPEAADAAAGMTLDFWTFESAPAADVKDALRAGRLKPQGTLHVPVKAAP